jgi:hypothetical protein
LVLVSGSLTYVKALPAEAANLTLVPCNKHLQSKGMFSQLGFRWMWLHKDTSGGVTRFQAMLGTNIPDFKPERTGLQRGICHVLDYGIKPSWSLKGDNAQSLGLDNWLHPDDLRQTVSYHTHYSATGWGLQ